MEFKDFDRKIGTFLIAYQILLFVSLPFYFYFFTVNTGTVIATIVLMFLTGMSITAGYHRFYSHRSYKINRVIEAVILFFSTMAMQGSVIRWSYNHRMHHMFVDKEEDPHNIKKGLFFAHMLWLLRKQRPIEEKVVSDLMQNRWLVFQNKYYNPLTFGANILVFLLVGWLFNDFIGAFVLAFWTRLFLVHHFTWFINSLAHTFGAKTYSREQTAVNNAIVALLTFGEGYHNYHHVFASDYRNGVRWFQYDPTKWLIWTLSKLGLAHELKKIDNYTSKQKIIMEDRHIFLEALKESTYEKKHTLQQKVIEMSEGITQKIANIKNLIKVYSALKENKANNNMLNTLRQKISQIKNEIKKDWRSWRSLESEISRHALLHHHHYS